MDSVVDTAFYGLRMSVSPFGLLVPIISLLVFYGVIRIAVAHGMRDAWRWRSRNGNSLDR